jgi:hypothetical protein
VKKRRKIRRRRRRIKTVKRKWRESEIRQGAL